MARERDQRPPFPLGWVVLVAAIVSARQLAGGGDIRSSVLLFVLAFALLGCVYLYRVRRLNDPGYEWLRERLKDEKSHRHRRRPPPSRRRS